LPWLRLMRLPNVFTAIADVAMGCLVAHGSMWTGNASQFVCLVATSALLYIAGMVLNDVFDFAVDAIERPCRPLPSGQIAVGVARRFGFVLLVLGILAGWAAGYLNAATAIHWRSGLIASALAACIVAYDGWFKFTPFGPLAMGICRFLNVLLGLSVAPQPLPNGLLGYGGEEFFIASGIGLYIVGVTWFARSEASKSDRAVLLLAMVVMVVGTVLLGSAASDVAVFRIDPPIYWMLLGLLMVSVLRRCAAAFFDPVPEKVQAAVKHSILSLIWLDAATALAAAGPLYGVAIAALLIPALLLGRWVYST
jgi:4-hydroxybenzoate polyprenyltransferase